VAPALAALAAEAGRPADRVLCHRDYHSRNLMLPPRARAAGGRLVIIDFQDARLGPRAYDLASLLEDPYVDLTDGLRERMTARFLDGICRPGRAPEYAAEYAAVAAQRLLKAAGTFAGQQTRFGVDRYLVYIPRALARARAMLERLPEHHALLRAVERWAARADSSPPRSRAWPSRISRTRIAAASKGRCRSTEYDGLHGERKG
jgi:aminoglycoside/choline kinase family phosphotransferase